MHFGSFVTEFSHFSYPHSKTIECHIFTAKVRDFYVNCETLTHGGGGDRIRTVSQHVSLPLGQLRLSVLSSACFYESYPRGAGKESMRFGNMSVQVKEVMVGICGMAE